MAPLDVVIHRPLIDNVSKFFTLEESVDLSEIQNRVNYYFFSSAFFFSNTFN